MLATTTKTSLPPPKARKVWRKFKRALQKWLRARGYELRSTRRPAPLDQAAYLRRLFDLLDITCVLDVGANAGQYRQFLRSEVGFRGRIVSFEPAPGLAPLLVRKSAQDPLWDIHEFALGSRCSTADLNIMVDSQFTSLLEPTDRHTGFGSEKNKVSATVPVKVETLASIWESLGIDGERIYLKLDTQGYDLECLKGAGTHLQEVRALQTEASILPLYEGMPDYNEVIGYCESAGFVLSGIYPNNYGQFPVLVEFDCHLIRREFIPEASGPG